MPAGSQEALEIAGKTLTLKTGTLAVQATASVLARLGDTVVLATVVEGGKSDLDYFPLSVDYVERLYAGGKIKGSRWVKREGRPSDEAILAGRLIDRSIRPLFPKEFKNEVQVIVTVLSVDGENDPDILALNAVSAAIAISRIPWNGPVAAVRVGCVKEGGNGGAACIINPGAEQEFSELDLVVSQSKDKTVMIEAGANQISEEILIDGIEKSHVETQKIIVAIEKLVKKVGQPKLEIADEAKLHETAVLVEKSYKEEVQNLIDLRVGKEGGANETHILVDKIYEDTKLKDPKGEIDKKTIAQAVEKVMFSVIRANVLRNGKRADSRKMDEIRPISAQVGILPRTHGSALFQRGITQALSVVTLGSPRLEQLIESAEGEESKRYIHHYSGLPYSFGQTGRVGTPARREIGHGALAEKAIIPVIPSQEEFPYTIRVVSEILSQNGSSSMASTCGSTLALMDAGVPIKKPVAGISIGMISDEGKYELLTDIIGLEDFSGDMDFKVAGTESGVTAIQLDVKIPGLTVLQIKEILERAKQARLKILSEMLKVIPKSRENISVYAPKIETIQIPVDKIGELIGPGGKMIKHIIATTGAQVDVEDDGTVTVSGVEEISVQKAADWIKSMMREIVIGETFEGEVKRILPFGAFVEFLPGKEGMVHVSQMSTGFVKDPRDVVSIGDKVKVRVSEIDEQGRINLSMLMEEQMKEAMPSGPLRREASRQGRDERQHGSYQRREEAHRESPRSQASGAPVHPLVQQFRRERFSRPGGPPRRSGFGNRDRRPRY
ncbi:MAG: polyribonucleotide nucleotidyltransferase [Candidatus Levybacteria bacterium]|nr:polyribonucleotide nucleotidyltransferase [Candidatus Levybacteria bacterium]